MKTSFTRYFTFVKVNPVEKDYDKLERVAKRMKAFMGYKLMKNGEKEYLVGFILLFHRDSVFNVYPQFPNFLVKPMDGPMDWDAVERTYDRVFGVHPFSDIRRCLFS